MSSTGSTMPRPKKWAQTRLATLVAKSGLSARGQPFGQHLAAVLALDVGRGAAQELRRHRLPGHRVRHLAAAGVEDDRLAIVLALLAADLGEERREAVVVVHRPAVERMVVALGALRANAHEHLGHVLGRLQRVALDLVEVRGRVAERAAGGAEQLPDHLVQRHVRGDLVGQPVGVEKHRLVADLVARLDHQQFGPLHGPDLGELLALQQPVDQLGPLAPGRRRR